MKGGYFTSTFWILISCISGHAKKSTCCYIKALLALVLWYWSFRCCISKCRIKGIDHRVHERGMIGLTCLMMPSKTGFILCWLCTFLSLFLCGIEESSFVRVLSWQEHRVRGDEISPKVSKDWSAELEKTLSHTQASIYDVYLCCVIRNVEACRPKAHVGVIALMPW